MREKTLFQKKWTFCGGTNHSTKKCFKKIRQETEKDRAAGASDNRQTEQTPRKYFRCGYEYHLFAKFPKVTKDNKKWRKKESFIEKGNRTCKNSENISDQNIYASMARMSGIEKYPSGSFGFRS